jgi:asparagine synthase (glutamine-hydrolysing)
MQEASSQPVKTFTIGFHEKEFNEAPYAKAIANHLGTAHTEHLMPVDDAINVIPKLPTMYDEPFADSSQIPTYLVSEIARKHVTVSLSGDGGDEVFAGYVRYQMVDALWDKIQHLPSGLRRVVATLALKAPEAIWDNFAYLFRGPYQQTHMAHKIKKGLTLLKSDTISEFYMNHTGSWPLKTPLLDRHQSSLALDVENADVVGLLQQYDFLMYLPDDILTKVDRASMAVSLEAREPLLDHRLVELAWRAPTAFKVLNGVTKRPLRDILYQYVPKEMIERPKMGFGVPVGHWLRGPLRDWAEDLLDAQKIKEDGLLDGTVIQKMWKKHQKGTYDWHAPLWGVLMFQAWKRQWKS